jgi:T5SS/PEP-CTERM-associated repeat protein
VAFVGANGGAGQVFVNGAGTSWSNPEDLFVGFDRKGEVFVTEGAQINSGPVQLGSAPFGDGFVTVDGSTWTSDAEFKVGIAGTALLTVVGGGAVSAEEVIVGPRGTIQGNSHVAANVLNGGTIAPGSPDPAMQGSSLGTLFIDGDYEQTSAGRLNLQLSSLSIFDKLVIDGHAVLDGRLNGSLLDGFMPAVGSAFQILTATGGIEGTFDLTFTAFGPIAGGPTWILDYSNTDVVLRRIMPPTGDYNRNGTVDAADYTVWRNTLGQMGAGLAADGDDDGMITQMDYTVWKSHYGETAGSGASLSTNANSAEVPEPNTIALMLLAIIALRLKRYRPRCRSSRRPRIPRIPGFEFVFPRGADCN